MKKNIPPFKTPLFWGLILLGAAFIGAGGYMLNAYTPVDASFAFASIGITLALFAFANFITAHIIATATVFTTPVFAIPSIISFAFAFSNLSTAIASTIFGVSFFVVYAIFTYRICEK